MSIMDLIGVLAFGLECFSLGFTICKEIQKTQK